MNDPLTLAEAQFNRKVRIYWLLSGIVVCVATVVGILLLPFWLLLGYAMTERYLQNMSCTLTQRSLKVKRGVLVRREMTVPLDKITDIALVEGPIMRMLDLQALKIETAGQSSPGAAVQLVGVVGARDFRDTVLRQRDRLADRAAAESPTAEAANPGGSGTATEQLLAEISDTLKRIEQAALSVKSP